MKVDKQKLDNVHTALKSLHSALSDILDNPLPDHDGGNDDNLVYEYNSDNETTVFYYELYDLRLIRYVLDFWDRRELHNLVLSKRFCALGVNFNKDIGDKNE